MPMLLDNGFALNPCDLCASKVVIDGSHCIMSWYIDDNQIYHADPNVVTKIIKILEERFGKMVVTRGCKNDFLGLDLNLEEDRVLEV